MTLQIEEGLKRQTISILVRDVQIVFRGIKEDKIPSDDFVLSKGKKGIACTFFLFHKVLKAFEVIVVHKGHSQVVILAATKGPKILVQNGSEVKKVFLKRDKRRTSVVIRSLSIFLATYTDTFMVAFFFTLFTLIFSIIL